MVPHAQPMDSGHSSLAIEREGATTLVEGWFLSEALETLRLGQSVRTQGPRLDCLRGSKDPATFRMGC